MSGSNANISTKNASKSTDKVEDAMKRLRMIQVSLHYFEKSNTRIDRIADPSTRSLMLLDRLCAIFDLFEVGIDSMLSLNDPRLEATDQNSTEMLKYNELVEEVRKKSKQITTQHQTHIGNMIDWIQSPSFDSDGAIGSKHVNESINKHGFSDKKTSEKTEENV